MSFIFIYVLYPLLKIMLKLAAIQLMTSDWGNQLTGLCLRVTQSAYSTSKALNFNLLAISTAIRK